MGTATGLYEAVIASLIAAMGLVSLALAASRSRSGQRAALWFGIFAGLYAVRLAGQSALLQPLLPEAAWRYLSAAITYAILTPGGLFVEASFGAGWRKVVRRGWQVTGVYAALAILNDAVRGQPGATLWLNPPVVLIAGGIGVAQALAHSSQRRWPRDMRVAMAGGLVFVAGALYQTFGGRVQVEPVAMLVFMTSMGYLVAQGMLAGERRLVAMTRELDLAREIQRSILPRALPIIPGLSIAAAYLPMNEIGGDFYDFDTGQPGGLGLLVADASGHGVPAALVASMVKVAFAAESEHAEWPGVALTKINRTLCGRFEGAYVTACCGWIDPAGRRLRYASAGHPSPLRRRRNGFVEPLVQLGVLLAFDAGAAYATAEVALEPGDRLVFFSDGLLEAVNTQDEYFGDTRLEALLGASGSMAPEAFVDALVEELHRFIGEGTSLQDDVTLVVVDVA